MHEKTAAFNQFDGRSEGTLGSGGGGGGGEKGREGGKGLSVSDHKHRTAHSVYRRTSVMFLIVQQSPAW